MEGPSGALVGRAAELDFARGVLADREAGCVVIGGVAGVGKSRLVTELCDELESTSSIRRAVATATARTVPFGALAPLMPPRWDEAQSSLAPPDREQLLRRMRGTLVASDDGRPVLLVIDDVHLLDDASAMLVRHVASTGEASLLLTVRANEPCPAELDALLREGRCARLELQPLSRNETAALASSLTGTWMEESSLHRLFEITGGSPLYVREILVDARRAGTLVQHRGLLRWTGTVGAPRLTDLVAAELGQRSEAERDFLDVLAVGEPLPVLAAGALADHQVLRALEDDGIVTVGDEVVRFGHPMYGEVRRAHLKPIRQHLIEQRLVRAFEDTEITDPDQRLRALCWRLPAAHQDAGELVEAGQRLFSRGDVARAEWLVYWARRIGGSQPEAELLLAEILEYTGRPRDAVELLEGSTQRLTNDRLRARAICCRIRIFVDVLNRVDQAERVAEEITAVVDPVWRGYLDAQWATTLAMLGRPLDVAATGERLFVHPDERVRLRAAGTVNLTALATGKIEAGLAATTSMVGPAIRWRDEIPQAPSWIFSALIIDLLALGRLAELDSILEIASAAPSSRVPVERAFELLIRGKLALFRGQPATARRYLTESVGLYAGNDPRGLGVSASSSLVLCCAQLRDVEGAAAAVADAERHPLGQESRLLSHDVRRELAWEPLARGDADLAVRNLMEVADAALEAGLPVFAGFALHDAVRLGPEAGPAERLAEVAADVDGELAEGWRRHAAGLAEDAGPALEGAAEHFEGLGYTLVAAELYAAAHHAFGRAGLVASASRVRALAGALRDSCEGAIAGPISLHSSADRLTGRELQVARLAATGLSSRAIADSLAVSVRTIDNQLGRIYTKLGVAGRHELGAALGEAPLAG